MDQVTIQTIIEGGILIVLVYLGTRLIAVLENINGQLKQISGSLDEIDDSLDDINDTVKGGTKGDGGVQPG